MGVYHQVEEIEVVIHAMEVHDGVWMITRIVSSYFGIASVDSSDCG